MPGLPVFGVPSFWGLIVMGVCALALSVCAATALAADERNRHFRCVRCGPKQPYHGRHPSTVDHRAKRRPNLRISLRDRPMQAAPGRRWSGTDSTTIAPRYSLGTNITLSFQWRFLHCRGFCVVLTGVSCGRRDESGRRAGAFGFHPLRSRHELHPTVTRAGPDVLHWRRPDGQQRASEVHCPSRATQLYLDLPTAFSLGRMPTLKAPMAIISARST